VCGLFAAMLLYWWYTAKLGDELRMSIAKVSSRRPFEQAVANIGEPPHASFPVSGVLLNGVTMLDAKNPKAAKHGKPKNYILYTWQKGMVGACVAVDSNGDVAGRWTWKEQSIPELLLEKLASNP